MPKAKKTTKTAEFGLLETGGVRTRFAPSPTGFLHIGGLRTALFNYLFAKQNKGSFILRIEDTDKERSKPEFEKDIMESLKWFGLDWDEFYRQSERIAVYKKYLKKLLEEKKAYYCFCAQEELETRRQEQESRGVAPKYSGKCDALSEKEVEENLKAKKPFVIRFKVPAKKVEINDLIRGKVIFDAGLLGDIVIAKNLDAPIFHFSNVVDDYEMKITHVMRGEEHLSNTPRHVLLQEALGFPIPKYAHIPLILAPDKSKLSKRHGAVSVEEYRRAGYLPEALINFLAFLGWNPGTDKEIYSLASLIKDFSLDRVHKGGAVFNIKKLDFINSFYVNQKTIDQITELCLPYLIEKGLIEPLSEAKNKEPALAEYFGKEYRVKKTNEKINFDYLKRIVASYRERLKKLSEISELTEFFFQDKLTYEKGLLVWKGMGESDIFKILEKLEYMLKDIPEKNWQTKKLEEILIPEAAQVAADLKQPGDRGYLLWPFRAALTGQKFSAGPFEIAQILGKEKTLARIAHAKDLLR